MIFVARLVLCCNAFIGGCECGTLMLLTCRVNCVLRCSVPQLLVQSLWCSQEVELQSATAGRSIDGRQAVMQRVTHRIITHACAAMQPRDLHSNEQSRKSQRQLGKEACKSLIRSCCRASLRVTWRIDSWPLRETLVSIRCALNMLCCCCGTVLLCDPTRPVDNQSVATD